MTDQPARPALPVPTAAWALSWSCLADQVLVLGERGARSSATGMLVSALIGAVVVAWISNGVLTARRGRLVLVWAIFVLSAILCGVALIGASVAGASDWRFVDFASSLVQLACLGGLIVVAVLVGALGGVIGAPEDAPLRFRINV